MQEVFLRALLRLEHFSGRSSFKTWALVTARNHLMSMARAAKIRPGTLGDAEPGAARPADPMRRMILRSGTKELLAQLRENPDQIEHGWQVLNLMLLTQGDLAYTALALTLHTGRPWTTERVRHVVDRIKRTPQGRALCSALGND